MNRRQFFAALAAGGVITATGLWMPGQKLISIPRSVVMTATEVELRNAAYYKMLTERLHRVVNPAMTEAIRDLTIFGHSKIKIDADGCVAL